MDGAVGVGCEEGEGVETGAAVAAILDTGSSRLNYPSASTVHYSLKTS